MELAAQPPVYPYAAPRPIASPSSMHLDPPPVSPPSQYEQPTLSASRMQLMQSYAAAHVSRAVSGTAGQRCALPPALPLVYHAEPDAFTPGAGRKAGESA